MTGEIEQARAALARLPQFQDVDREAAVIERLGGLTDRLVHPGQPAPGGHLQCGVTVNARKHGRVGSNKHVAEDSEAKQCERCER